MQIPTLVRRFTSIFLRYLLARDLPSTFCDFDTVAFLIISTVSTAQVNADQLGQLSLVNGHVTIARSTGRHVLHSIMTNVM